MRRILVLILALTLLAPPAGAGSAARPSLRVLGSSPVKVSGKRFHPRERVRLILTGTKKVTRYLRASRSGTFVATLEVSMDRCSGFWIRAVGSQGSRATAKQPPLPACLPA